MSRESRPGMEEIEGVSEIEEAPASGERVTSDVGEDSEQDVDVEVVWDAPYNADSVARELIRAAGAPSEFLSEEAMEEVKESHGTWAWLAASRADSLVVPFQQAAKKQYQGRVPSANESIPQSLVLSAYFSLERDLENTIGEESWHRLPSTIERKELGDFRVEDVARAAEFVRAENLPEEVAHRLEGGFALLELYVTRAREQVLDHDRKAVLKDERGAMLPKSFGYPAGERELLSLVTTILAEIETRERAETFVKTRDELIAFLSEAAPSLAEACLERKDVYTTRLVTALAHTKENMRLQTAEGWYSAGSRRISLLRSNKDDKSLLAHESIHALSQGESNLARFGDASLSSMTHKVLTEAVVEDHAQFFEEGQSGYVSERKGVSRLLKKYDLPQTLLLEALFDNRKSMTAYLEKSLSKEKVAAFLADANALAEEIKTKVRLDVAA